MVNQGDVLILSWAFLALIFRPRFIYYGITTVKNIAPELPQPHSAPQSPSVSRPAPCRAGCRTRLDPE
ncbi:hypothetical protein ACN38_g11332 [Penicillium nordicum]|uniref:Uncharacterized protein n=1 Tax=Penicillium nordicum TaxID=229535 RepID=A0A0M9WB15_9EURO|nr:hypothetical protein ACN38_g11332 [Penicillium nordicum]